MSTLSFTLNSKPVEVSDSKDRDLLWVLRTDLGLTGTKYGCGKGTCGACTVLVNEKATRSCITSVARVKNKDVVTVEGLEDEDGLHPLQKNFMEEDALQCGYCTPGMIMSGVALLKKNPNPTREQINRHMNRNLCRCGAHQRIVAAIESAAGGNSTREEEQ